MATFITIIHVIACLFLVLVVLLQAGKGGGMGVAFGSGTSSAVFGGRGAGSFLEKLTAGTAIVFMLTSMTLAWYASQSDSARLQRRNAETATQKKTDDKKAADEKEAREAADRAKGTAPAPDKSSTSSTTSEPAAPAAAPAAPPAAPAAPAAPAPAAPAPAQPDKAAHPATAPPKK
jgi:preprotein translocase subunit SecG